MTKKIRNLIILTLVVGVGLLFVSSAWATLSFVKPKDTSPEINRAIKAEINAVSSQRQKSRAPEPATMALFGSGFLGMVMSFLRKTYAAIKRIFDVCAASLGIVLLSPLFLLTAILVKLTSKGPIIYSQTRVGKSGRHFDIFKFRTMKVDAEKETGAVWAAKNDSRLTPIGSFLRKTRIDEIPQFFNILRGEMSLIGPRPERPVFVQRFTKEIPNYQKRLAVKPGITGLAQVWHKYDETIEDVKKKITYDLVYIRRLSVWTDFGILLRTFRVVLTGQGAR